MKYEAHVTGREGRWWIVAIPALDGLTQARRLEEVADEARDYIAVALDVPYSEVEVQVIVDDFGGIENIGARAAQIRAAREEIERLERQTQLQAIDLAIELAKQGIPLREIAELTGYTFQRIGQMTAGQIDEAPAEAPKKRSARTTPADRKVKSGVVRTNAKRRVPAAQVRRSA